MTDVEMVQYSVIGIAILYFAGSMLFDRRTKKAALRKSKAKVKEHVREHVLPAVEETLLAKKDSLENDMAKWLDEGGDSDRTSEFETSVCLQGEALCIEDVVVRTSDLIAIEVKGSDREPKITDGKAARWWDKTSDMTLKNNHWSFEVDGVAYAVPYTNPILKLPEPVKFTFIVSGQMGGDHRYTATCDVRDYYEIRAYVDGLASKAFGDRS